jgi:hypothetical protein
MKIEKDNPQILKTNCGWHVEYNIDGNGKPIDIDENHKPIENGGLVIKNIRHDNYPLATDIRVKGFWVEFKQFKKNDKGEIKEEKKVLKKYYENNSSTFNYSVINELNLKTEEEKKIIILVNPKLQKTNKVWFYCEDNKQYLKSWKEVLEKKQAIPKQNKVRSNIGQNFKMDSVLVDLHQFQKYEFIKGLQTKYSLKNELSIKDNKNIDMKSFSIIQTFLFSKYSNNPSHEPSGALSAARLFPLIKFEFAKRAKDEFDKSKDYYEVFSIRADYRFEYNMSSFINLNPSKPELDENADKQTPFLRVEQDKKDIDFMRLNLPQQAAVFADNEHFIDNNKILPNAGSQLFDSAEKPLVYEMVGVGLKETYETTTAIDYSAKSAKESPKFWDNIHWWGGYKNYHIISAPGGFHCCHMHWRWGQHLQKPFKIGNIKLENILVKDAGEIQYKSSMLGGVLLDPKIPEQNIQFAIVKKDISNEKDVSGKKGLFTVEESFDDFKNHFQAKRTNKLPKKIREGDNLVLNLSFTSLNISKYPTGTFCIHGLFFAHEHEPTFSGDEANKKAYVSGDDDPFYKNPGPSENNVKRTFLRNPYYGIKG